MACSVALAAYDLLAKCTGLLVALSVLIAQVNAEIADPRPRSIAELVARSRTAEQRDAWLPQDGSRGCQRADGSSPDGSG